MKARARTGLALALAAWLAAGLTGCDGEDTGPGDWQALLQRETPVSAAVLEVTGQGIEGVDGTGATRAFAAMTVPDDGSGLVTWRIVVVAPETEPGFRVHVRDVSAPAPEARIVSAAGPDDRLISSLIGVKVELAR